jgi:PmbA protein
MKGSADECEVYSEERTERTITVQKDEIYSEREKSEATMGVRAIVHKKRGFTAVTLPSSDDIYHSVMKSARIQEPDADWNTLPHPRERPSVTGLCDPRIRDLSMESLLELSTAIRSPFPDISVNSARLTAITSSVHILNSHGISQEYQATKYYLFVSCLHTRRNTQAVMNYAVSRHLDIDVQALVKETCSIMKQSERARSLEESFTGEVLFSAQVVNQIFINALAAAISAQNVHRGVSYFKERLHTPVASEMVTVIDDGLLAGGVCSAPFDREGTPCQRTEVITTGILQNFIHDQYTAPLFHTDSTGNAVGSAMIEPLIGISNCLIKPSNTCIEEMVNSVQEGLYVRGLSGGTDVTTGNFSGVVPHGLYIKNGEIMHSTRALISGNSFSGLCNVEMVGSEYKANLEGMYGVPLLIKDIDIIAH